MKIGNAISALLYGTRLGNAFDALTNRYDAAQWTDTRSQRRANLGADRIDVTKATREILQGKALDFDQNSETFNQLADTWEQYTVGTGLQPTPATSDSEYNKAALETWENWKPFADVSSRFSFDAKQGVISRETFVFGGDFVILTRDPSNNRPRIQCIEAHFCKTPPRLAEQEGKTIFDGVEVDTFGRPQRYWFQTDTTRYEPFDSWQVIHIFEPSRHGQLRERPYIACATNTLTDMLDLAELEMQHSKVNAQNSLNVYTENGQLPPGMAYNNRRFTDALVQNPNATSGEQQRIEYYRNGYGGRVNVAMRGDRIEEHISERPSESWRSQQRDLREKVCAGTGISYVLAFPDSMQGTVYRGSLDAATAFFRSKSAMFVGHFQRIYEFVLNQEANFNPRLQKRPFDWKKSHWLPPAAPNTDIGYNSAAALNELRAGVKSWDDIALPQGRKGEDSLRRKGEQVYFIKKLAKQLSQNAEGIEVRPEEIASEDLSPAPVQAPEEDPPTK